LSTQYGEATQLDDGAAHTARIVYQPVAKMLYLYIDGAPHTSMVKVASWQCRQLATTGSSDCI